MITYKQYLSESFKFATAGLAYEYAKKLNKRIPEAEEIILAEGSAHCIYIYAKDVVKGRWPEGEDAILNSTYKLNYLEFLMRQRHSPREKLNWLKTEGVTEKLLEILNYIGMNWEVQEYIIKKRPDLTSEIYNLDPRLQKKYAYELELGNVEI